MTIGALIFDYDGLIVDSERIEADLIIEAVKEWGAEITYADFGHLFGSVDADHHWEALMARWCGRTLEELEARIHPIVPSLKETQPLLPGVRELIDAAHAAGVRIGLGTGNRLDVLERRLGRHGVFDRFDGIVTRADVANGKPAPDIYLEVARRLDVAPADCLVLEDSVPGCEAGIAAGMRVIACPSVVSTHCEFPVGIERVASLLEVRL
ncbi:MAG: HAD family phosphatase [Actinobacteria bacterium]|nr:HAD family phosphatase [Actinomycetota bacterium]